MRMRRLGHHNGTFHIYTHVFTNVWEHVFDKTYTLGHEGKQVDKTEKMLHSSCDHILSELSCRTSMRTGRNVWVNVIWWIICHLFQFGNVWNPDLPNPVYSEMKASWTLWDYNVEAKNGVQWKFKGKLELRIYLFYLQGHIDMSTNMLMAMLNLWCKTTYE